MSVVPSPRSIIWKDSVFTSSVGFQLDWAPADWAKLANASMPTAAPARALEAEAASREGDKMFIWVLGIVLV
jgi:hypothetical protein